MPRYECKGNIWHNDVYYPKGSFAELPEGEKSDLFVLVTPAPVAVAAPVVEPEAVAEPAVEAEPTEDTEPGKKKGKRKSGWFSSDEPKDG